jgi:hypothetical protein
MGHVTCVPESSDYAGNSSPCFETLVCIWSALIASTTMVYPVLISLGKLHQMREDLSVKRLSKASRLEQDVASLRSVGCPQIQDPLASRLPSPDERDLRTCTKAAKLRRTQHEPKSKGMSGALFLHGEGIRMPLDARTPRKEVQTPLDTTGSDTVHK